MDKSQARLILGIDPEPGTENLRDAFEEAVFKEVTFFLRRSFLPVLAEKRIKKLEEVEQAAQSLGLECERSEVKQYAYTKLPADNDLLLLLSHYHSIESQVKSNLVNSIHPREAISCYREWISLFESFAQRYIAVFESLKVDMSLLDQEEVRISDEISFDELNAELKAREYSNLAGKLYYRLLKIVQFSK